MQLAAQQETAFKQQPQNQLGKETKENCRHRRRILFCGDFLLLSQPVGKGGPYTGQG